MEQPLVSIQCLVFNHEPYLRQCLDGFVMQKTNFKFEAIVHDDVSSDGSAAIIREYAEKYPDIIKPMYESENQYSKRDGSLQRIMDQACKGKYIAFCEGDDYWIDSMKLQKQVDFLELHSDYGLCHTDYIVVDEYGNLKQKGKKQIYKDDEYLYKMIAKGNCIGTLTVMLRKSVYDNTPRFAIGKGWALGDKPRWLEMAALSKVGYINEVTSSYRIVEGSASHGRDMRKVLQFASSGFELDNFYDEKYKLGVNRPKSEFYEYCLKEALRIGDRKVARDLFIQSINDRSMNLKILFLFLFTILSLTKIFSLIRAIKR